MSDSINDIISAMGWTEADMRYAKISTAKSYDPDPKLSLIRNFPDLGVATSVFYSKADAGQLLRAANESMPELELTKSYWSGDGSMGFGSAGSAKYNMWALVDGPLGSILFITIGTQALDDPTNDHGLLAPTGNWPNKAGVPIQHCILKDGEMFSGVVDILSAADLVDPWNYPGFEATKRLSPLAGKRSIDCCMTSSQRKALNDGGWERLDFELYRKSFTVTDHPDRSFIISVTQFGLDYADDPVLCSATGEGFNEDGISNAYSGMCMLGPYSTLLINNIGVVVRSYPPDASSNDLDELSQQFADDLFRWESWRSPSMDPTSMPGDERYAAAKMELLRNYAIIGRKGDIEGKSGTEQEDLGKALAQTVGMLRHIPDQQDINPLLVQGSQIILNGLVKDSIDFDAIDQWFGFMKSNGLTPDHLDGIGDLDAGILLLEDASILLLVHRHEIVTARNLMNQALNRFSTPEGELRGYINFGIPPMLWMCDYPGFRSMLRHAPLD